MSDFDDVQTRIARANIALEDLNARRERHAFRSGGATEPGIETVARTAPSKRKRKATTQGGDGNANPAPRSYQRPLGAGGEEHERGSEDAAGNPAQFSPRGETDRQVTRSKASVNYQDALTKKLKRALAYAGFDVTGDARALSESEQKDLLPHVTNFMQHVGIAIDWAITHSNKDHVECEIWSFEEDEAEILAKIYLKRARKIGWMAQVARQAQHIENLGDGKDVAQVLGKRLVATGIFYRANGGIELWLNGPAAVTR